MRRERLTQVIPVRLTEHVVASLDRIAMSEETTRSHVIRKVLAAHTRREEQQAQTASERQ